MNKRNEICFLVVALLGGAGFGYMLSPVLRRISPAFSSVFCAVVFFGFVMWLLQDIQKELRIRDEERAAVLKHERKKQSVILSRHPLLESPEDPRGIRSMDELGYYFNEHEDDVSGMDYDRDGRYIFADHKYIRG